MGLWGWRVGRRAARAVWLAGVMWGVVWLGLFGEVDGLAVSGGEGLAKRVAIKKADSLVEVEGGGSSIFAG